MTEIERKSHTMLPTCLASEYILFRNIIPRILDRTVLGGTARLRTMVRILYFTSPVHYGMEVAYEDGRY